MLKTIIFPHDIPNDLISSGEVIACCFQRDCLAVGIPGEARQLQSNFNHHDHTSQYILKDIQKHNTSTIYSLGISRQLDIRKHRHPLNILNIVSPKAASHISLENLEKNEIIICKTEGDDFILVSSSASEQIPSGGLLRHPRKDKKNGMLYILEHVILKEGHSKMVLLECLQESSDFLGLSLEVSKKAGFSLGFLSKNPGLIAENFQYRRFSTVQKQMMHRRKSSVPGGVEEDDLVRFILLSNSEQGQQYALLSLLLTGTGFLD